MTFAGVVQTAVLVAVAVGAVAVATRLAWRAIGAFKISRAGPRRLRAARHLIWRDPGDVRALDLVHGPGGPDYEPQPPFRFIEEHLSGSQPCVSVIDGRGRRWRVKWGNEVRAENFAVRLVWACGFFAETTYFVPAGRIEGAANLSRAKACIGDDCAFAEARFELDDPDVRKLFEEHSWSWNENPFVGTRELHGLKVLTMLLSDWDTKDRRDVARGSNTAIFEHRVRRFRWEARYLITDWGGSMGRWGANIVTRGRWDPAGFAAQTPQFVTGVQDGIVRFGYAGQRTADVAEGIRVADVRWLNEYLGRITNAQIHGALIASGANDEDATVFARAIRDRISQLSALGSQLSAVSGRSPANVDHRSS
ncbi:MAG TPA: hypothetical protein VFJ02_15085 [Vicinamibacterales bacterium]|nr:hypothetical protein [Vicinamibacterales bacterium]